MQKKSSDDEYFDCLNRHYLPLIHQHRNSFKAVDWGSSLGQQLRFQVLLEVGRCQNTSVLDVGCGVGHLRQYLSHRDYTVSYTGIDVIPEMVAVAQNSYPDSHFCVGDITRSGSQWMADYVFGSGLFTFGNYEIMKSTIQAMYNSCSQALAFNSLSSWSSQKESQEFYADPLLALEFCHTLTPWVTLRHDYMPHDFTIYMYREQNNK
jgi:SAM-dependent methyltransferase